MPLQILEKCNFYTIIALEKCKKIQKISWKSVFYSLFVLVFK